MMLWIKIKIQMTDNYIHRQFCVLRENSIAKLTTEYGL